MLDVKKFLFALPAKVDPDKIAGLHDIFHFQVEGSGDYTITVDDGKLDVAEGLHGEPDCTVKASVETLEKLFARELNPMKAVMFGKLKISNISKMMSYASLFGLA